MMWPISRWPSTKILVRLHTCRPICAFVLCICMISQVETHIHIPVSELTLKNMGFHYLQHGIIQNMGRSRGAQGVLTPLDFPGYLF